MAAAAVLYLFQKILGFFATDGPVEPNLLEQLSLEWAYAAYFSGFGSSSLEGDNGAASGSSGQTRSIGRQQSRRQWRGQGGRERIYFQKMPMQFVMAHTHNRKRRTEKKERRDSRISNGSLLTGAFLKSLLDPMIPLTYS
jgi:hypothetical protein